MKPGSFLTFLTFLTAATAVTALAAGLMLAIDAPLTADEATSAEVRS